MSDTPPLPRIAVFSGPTATIQNSQPLVTSNKARAQYGLPPRVGPDGRPLARDALRPQRLAAPVTVYVEQFSAHPLERDAADLYDLRADPWELTNLIGLPSHGEVAAMLRERLVRRMVAAGEAEPTMTAAPVKSASGQRRVSPTEARQ